MDKSKVAVEVIDSEVSAMEVGKSYLVAEFGRVFPGNNLVADIDVLDEYYFWRMLEAMSFSFRLNHVFWFISSENHSWSKEVWRIEDISLTGINPEVNTVIYSENVRQNPVLFRDFLINYFKQHPTDDPLSLDEFRLDEKEVLFPTILLAEKGDRIVVIDGSHRLVKLLLSGETTISAYIARETDTKGKIRIGESTFMLMRSLYQRGSEDEKEAVVKILGLLVKESIDGAQTIKEYWVDQIADPEQKKIGLSILERINKS